MSALLTAQGLGAVSFIVFVAMTIAGALLAVNTRRLIRSVVGLALCYIGLAGLFYFLHSPFVALMTILIYVGAVCVTILFGIMLAAGGLDQPDVPRRSVMGVGAAAVALVLFAALVHLVARAPWPDPANAGGMGTIQAVGRAFLTTHSLVFELISLVLLAAIIGALVVAREGREKP
jgi:NADH:ubiquinone oxidoreductase subunit 6 (subunit J)